MPVSPLPEGVSLVDVLAELAALRRIVVEQADLIAELQRQLGKDSSTSSRPPSSDAPWDKKLAKKRSSRTRSARPRPLGFAANPPREEAMVTPESRPTWYGDARIFWTKLWPITTTTR